MKSQCKAWEHTRAAPWLLCGSNCLFLYTELNEQGADKVADIPTGVAQDVSLGNTGSDSRCQNEVRTTKNSWFCKRKTNGSMI